MGMAGLQSQGQRPLTSEPCPPPSPSAGAPGSAGCSSGPPQLDLMVLTDAVHVLEVSGPVHGAWAHPLSC